MCLLYISIAQFLSQCAFMRILNLSRQTPRRLSSNNIENCSLLYLNLLKLRACNTISILYKDRGNVIPSINYLFLKKINYKFAYQATETHHFILGTKIFPILKTGHHCKWTLLIVSFHNREEWTVSSNRIWKKIAFKCS